MKSIISCSSRSDKKRDEGDGEEEGEWYDILDIQTE